MKIDHLESVLISAGMESKEASAYLLLIKDGPAKASQIQKAMGWKRGNTYALLDKLSERNLVEKKGLLFHPQPPLLVLNELKERNQQIGSALDHFRRIMPELMDSYQLSVGKPTIQYFTGEEGVKAVFEDIYSKKKQGLVYGCVDLEKAEQAFPALIMKKLIPKRIANQVKAISFIANSQQAKKLKELDNQQLRKSILVNKNKYPLPAEIDVYEDKIAMLTFTNGEFIGLVIQNQDLATTLESIFKLAEANHGNSK